MHLVQILLPVFDNAGKRQQPKLFQEIAQELTDYFGGLTAFTRAPAEGRWKAESEDTQHDEIIVFEVMAEELDRGWWQEYRRTLEKRFGQEEIVIRAKDIEQL